MVTDPRQFLLLAVGLAVPAVAFFLGRTRLVLAWVAFTLAVQVFDTTIVTNLPAGRLIGLLYLPATISLFPRWKNLPPARAWLINFVYLVALGILFGYVIPWPDTSGERPFSQRAEGRSVIYLVRTIADLSLTVFVGMQMLRPGAFEVLRKWMVRGAVVTSAAAFLTLVVGVDLYTAITGLREYAAFDFRPRGLAFEPRGLGLACAYGLILILGKPSRNFRDWLAFLVIVAGLLVSSSSTGLAAAVVGLVILAILGSRRTRTAMIAALITIGLTVATLQVVAPDAFAQSLAAITIRLRGRGTVEMNVATNVVEAAAYRMDIFDSSATLFLARNPRYAVFGTGPGLISLPATEHIPSGVYHWLFTRIDNPPSHGILLELSNTGVLGIGVWIFQVLAVFAAGRHLRNRRDLPFPPRAATTMFVAGAGLYAIQVSPSPFWAVFLGIGWGISAVSRSVSRRQDEGISRPDPELARRTGAVPAAARG
jgi:hypothetical protein